LSCSLLYEVDIAIIGAGVVGLAIAARVAGRNREVYILEKNETYGKETSSRNSEVIHAGIYYPKGSLKANTCVEGNAILYQLCAEHGIDYRNVGKIIVAITAEEVSNLEALLERGRANGVKGLKLLSKGEIQKIEPNIEATAAILSPATGIIDSHALMSYFLYEAREKGAKISYKSEVIGIEKLPEGYEVTIKSEPDNFSFRTRVLINCAGLNSDLIAKLAGIDINKAGYKLFYCKGEYFSVSRLKSKLIGRLIYPLPEPKLTSIGIHATVDLERKIRLGPNARYVDKVDYQVDESQKDSFYQSVRRYLPFIEYEDLEPEMAGIRPKLQGPGDDFRDFVIRHEQDKGLQGFINLVGIESPGLTGSPAIAKYVESTVNEIL